MKKWLVILCLITITSWSFPIYATNLLDVFQQALVFDPTFKTAEAQWLAAYELIPIARGALLPNISAAALVRRIHEDITFVSRVKFWDTSQQYSIQANQPIFNYAAWARLQQAKAQSKQAFALYNAAVQDLMMRVARAYFAVLKAYDQLQTTVHTRKSLEQQLHQTEEQYKLGLIAITGVLQVKTSYDQAVAQEVLNQNNIADKLEDLRALTGVFYTDLAGIQTDAPLVAPDPIDINQWVSVASQQNYAIKAAYYKSVAAMQNVKIQRAGHYPTITATSQYLYYKDSQQEFSLSPSQLAPETQRIASFGIQANLPIYSGGTVTAQTTQAAYQYAEAAAQMQQVYLDTLRKTRQGFLGVMSGISVLKADRTFVSSSQESLKATQTAYTNGTATIVDVLQQQSSYYTAHNAYAADQYNYILNSLILKQAAGTLSTQDLACVNQWLGKTISFSDYNFNQHLIHYTADTQAVRNIRSQPSLQPAHVPEETPEQYISAPRKTGSAV